MYRCNIHQKEIEYVCMKIGCNATIPSCQYCILGGSSIHSQHQQEDFITLEQLKNKAGDNYLYIRQFKKIMEELKLKAKSSIDQIEHLLKQLSFSERLNQCCSIYDLSKIAFNLRYPQYDLYNQIEQQYRIVSIQIDQQYKSLVIATKSLLQSRLQYQPSIQTFPPAHQNQITSIIASPTNKYIASAGEGGEIILWDLYSNQYIKEFNGEKSIRCLKFTPNEAYLVAGQKAQPFDILIFDINLPQSSKSLILAGHTNIITRMCFYMDQQYLMSVSLDGYLVIWDFSSTAQYSSTNFKFQLNGLAVNQYSKLLAVSSLEHGYIFLLQLNDLFKLDDHIIAHWQAHEICYCVEFILGSNLIITSGNDSINIWDYKKVSELMAHDLRKRINVDPTFWLTKNVTNVQDLVVSSDGKYLIYLDDQLCIWDLKERKNIQKIQYGLQQQNNFIRKQFTTTNDLRFLFVPIQNRKIIIYENILEY